MPLGASFESHNILKQDIHPDSFSMSLGSDDTKCFISFVRNRLCGPMEGSVVVHGSWKTGRFTRMTSVLPL